MGHVAIPAQPLFRRADGVRMNVGTSGRSKHRKSFSERSYPVDESALVLRQLCYLFCSLRARAAASVSDVMKLVRERVLELVAAYCRIHVKEDRRVCLHLIDEAVAGR